MNKIIDPAYPVPQVENATHGIEVKEFHCTLDNNTKFRVNIWDFGGQEIYHQTHQFFLTKRSLYALVADGRKDHPHLDYWLHIVELLSDNSPMLIIKNEKNGLTVDLKNESQIRGRFDTMVKEILTTNLANNQGLEKIIKTIKHYISDLPHIGLKLPKSWIRVREALEQDKRDYISLNDYLQICEDSGYPSKHTLVKEGIKRSDNSDGRLILSQFLHDLGIILHFQDDEESLLYDTVILKPEWGTDAIYKLLKPENNLVKTQQGKFTFQDLKLICCEPQYGGKHRELLELMKRFKLCYELPNKTYIAPQLLDTKQPEYDWDENQNLRLRYQYDFMPRGILSRFIVEMHRYIDEPKVWRSGVILTKDQTYAEVVETYNNREISIKLVGSNKRGLLELITSKLYEIHDRYHRLKVDKLIPCNCGTCKQASKPYFHRLDNLRNLLSNNALESQCQKKGEMVKIYSLIDDTIGREQLYRSNGNKYTFNIIDGETMENPHIQSHSGSGDNVAGNKTQQNNTFNDPVGMGGIQGNIEVKDNATVAGVVNQNEPQKLAEIAQEITDLLNYFEQNNPPLSEAIQKVNTAKENYPELEKAEIIEVAIENNPTVKQRILAAGKAAYLETIKALLPPVGVAIETIKAYQNPT